MLNKKNRLNQNRIYEPCDNEDAESILISIEEYNRYQNALRIIEDRALQQINKAKADEHGYTLLNAKKITVETTLSKKEAWEISKLTPHSLNIPADIAHDLIMQNLIDYYNFRNLPDIDDPDEALKGKTKLVPERFLQAIAERKENNQNKDYYTINNDFGRNIKKWLDQQPDVIPYQIEGFGTNMGQGVYTVTYVSSGLI